MQINFRIVERCVICTAIVKTTSFYPRVCLLITFYTLSYVVVLLRVLQFLLFHTMAISNIFKTLKHPDQTYANFCKSSCILLIISKYTVT